MTDFEFFCWLKLTCSRFRFNFQNEREMQAQIAGVLDTGRFSYRREYNLTPRERADFMVNVNGVKDWGSGPPPESWGIALELKVRGSGNDAIKQIARYANSAEVNAMILICTKPELVPDYIGPKRLYIISLGFHRL